MKNIIKKIVKTIIPSKKRKMILRKGYYFLSGGKKIRSSVPLSIIGDAYHS